MLTDSKAFSGFSVDDPEKARAFYEETLGLPVTLIEGARGSMLRLTLGSGAEVFVYTKPDHAPAAFTVLNFPVPDIEAAVDDLASRGVTFQRYEGMPFDERGIMTGGGPADRLVHRPGGQRLLRDAAGLNARADGRPSRDGRRSRSIRRAPACRSVPATGRRPTPRRSSAAPAGRGRRRRR